MFVNPRNANLLITAGCNLSCKHCTVYSHGPLQGELTPLQWGFILDKLVKAKLLTATISGGEPLHRPDFAEILSEFTSRPIRLGLNTNCTLVTRSTVEMFLKAGARLDMIMVSIDGDSPETHDALRGKGSFGRMMEGVSLLRKENLPVCFYCTVNSINISRIENIAELCSGLGQYVIFNIFVDSGPHVDSSLNPQPAQVAGAGRSILRAANRFPHGVRGTLLEVAMQAARVRTGTGSVMSSSRVCGGGGSKIAVLPDGSVTPCDHMTDLVFGNLLEDDLETILSSEKAVLFRKTSAAERNRPWAECESCKYLDYCAGPCPGAAPFNGSPKTKFSMVCLKNYIGE